ncbi:MAG: GGDEF domain-containing protein [Treponema sp.]|nr:GGDEF domain-containing protein [Treponema sp.]
MNELCRTIAFFYSQVDIFCIIIMAILLYTTLIDVDRNSFRYSEMNTIVAVIIFCLVDILWVLIYEGVLPRTVFTRTLSNALLYCSMNACSFSVFYLLEESLKTVSPIKNINKEFLFVPFFMMMLIPLATPFTGIMFSINADGSFKRGPLYIPYIVMIFANLVPTEIRAVVLSLRRENELHKGQCLMIAVNAIPVFAGGIAHFFFNELPSIAAGISVSVLLFYILHMRGQVSLDSLTGINNRKQGEKFFLRNIQNINMQESPSSGSLYLFIADLNKFKSINDTYGHSEGDNALVITAEALRDACSFYADKCMLCRFGGDEFVIGGMFDGNKAADYFCEMIGDCLAKKCSKKNLPYNITLSIGYERYNPEFRTLKNLLAAADKKMYEQKRLHSKAKN